MCHLVIKSVVIVLLAVEGGGCRDADHIIPGRVAGGKSRVVDEAKSRILEDGSRLFVRLGNALARCDCWGLDSLSLIQIEDIRPPDKRNAGWPAVLAHDHVPGFVPLFEDLVVDDRR